MPLTPAAIALLNALTISLTLAVCEPVHWYVQPSSLHASEAPLCVGVKNGFVVTWLTSVNLYLLLSPKIDAAELPLVAAVAVPVPAGELLLLLEPQASRIIAAIPAAPPV